MIISQLVLLPAFSFSIVLALLFIFATFLLLAEWHKSRYWQRRSIPGPRSKMFTGNLAALLFRPQSSVIKLNKWTGQFGKIYGVRYGQTNVLITSEPSMVHDLLISKFDQFNSRLIAPIAGNPDNLKWVHLFNAKGARWKRLRAIAAPAFSVTNLKKIIPTIDDSAKVAIRLFEESTGQPINIQKHFVELTFDIIARVAMGQKESHQFNSDAQLAVQAIQRINNNLFDYYAWVFPWFGQNVLHPLSTWTAKWRDDPIGRLLAKIARAVEERKNSRTEKSENAEMENDVPMPKDFIDLFLDAECDELELEHGQEGEKLGKISRKNCLEEVIMQCFLFVLAGFDTTASSLSQICHRLAWHPNVQAKVRAEIETAIPGDQEVPTYEQLAKLKYTEEVIKETLRLSPRVITRVCTTTTTLGMDNFLVEEGTGMQVDVLNMHSDIRQWGVDADKFRPERWMTSDSAAESPSSLGHRYLAFGQGPRICLGMRMALMEDKLVLARLLRKFTIEKCAETEKKIEFAGQVVLAPKSVTVKLEPRWK